MKRVWVVLLVFLLCPVASFADYLDVTEIDNLSVTSTFDAASRTLSWTKGKRVLLNTSVGTDYLFGTMSATFSGLTDESAGGTASAKFSTGIFTLSLFKDPAKTVSVGSISGSLLNNWKYWERETDESPSELYGSSLITIDSFFVHVEGAVQDRFWAEGVGSVGGLTCTTKNLAPSTISDYHSNWTSNNALVKILADESGIPEPATMVLLGLGSLSLLKRRK